MQGPSICLVKFAARDELECLFFAHHNWQQDGRGRSDLGNILVATTAVTCLKWPSLLKLQLRYDDCGRILKAVAAV